MKTTVTNTKTANVDNKKIAPNQEEKTSIAQRKFSYTLTRTLESKIFAKTKKTITDLRFEDSDWYQKFLVFRTNFSNITDTVNKNGENSLNEEEKVW